MTARQFLRMERRLLSGRTTTRPKPEPEPRAWRPRCAGWSEATAASIGAALAARYRPGDLVASLEIARDVGLGRSTVNHYLRILSARPGWAYAPPQRHRPTRL